MIYVAVIALVLALLFDFSVWAWLRANPVPPLAEIPDWRVRPRYPDTTNYHQAIQGAYATSAMAIIPLGGVSALTAWSPGAIYRVEDPREAQEWRG